MKTSDLVHPSQFTWPWGNWNLGRLNDLPWDRQLASSCLNWRPSIGYHWRPVFCCRWICNPVLVNFSSKWCYTPWSQVIPPRPRLFSVELPGVKQSRQELSADDPGRCVGSIHGVGGQGVGKRVRKTSCKRVRDCKHSCNMAPDVWGLGYYKRKCLRKRRGQFQDRFLNRSSVFKKCFLLGPHIHIQLWEKRNIVIFLPAFWKSDMVDSFKGEKKMKVQVYLREPLL